MIKNERIIVYIDGFNLYFGMEELRIGGVKWLNLRKLVEKLLKPNQELISINYYTSRVINNPNKEKRQAIYLDALKTQNINIVYGQYKDNTIWCKKCNHNWNVSKEKQTDVNIATDMMIGAFQDLYDTAFLITGDSDLVPPVSAIHSNFPSKRVFIAFPPNRHNTSLKNVAKGSMMIGKNNIKTSQFPDTVITDKGFSLIKPGLW
jgi:uncharacterized LabA/DUF88 family protein